MFISIPKGQPDGIKIIPVGDIQQKDEFSNVKNISAQDVLTAHRFPAGLAGIIPQNASGLGDPDKARTTYGRDEVTPVCRKFMQAVNSDPEIPRRYTLILRWKMWKMWCLRWLMKNNPKKTILPLQPVRLWGGYGGCDEN